MNSLLDEFQAFVHQIDLILYKSENFIFISFKIVLYAKISVKFFKIFILKKKLTHRPKSLSSTFLISNNDWAGNILWEGGTG